MNTGTKTHIGPERGAELVRDWLAQRTEPLEVTPGHLLAALAVFKSTPSDAGHAATDALFAPAILAAADLADATSDQRRIMGGYLVAIWDAMPEEMPLYGVLLIARMLDWLGVRDGIHGWNGGATPRLLAACELGVE